MYVASFEKTMQSGCIYHVQKDFPMKTHPVSLLVDIPEELHQSLQQYLDSHTLWHQDRVFQAALSLFLMQNGISNKSLSNLYLESLFERAA
ncbi:MAG: DUF2811 domain-containing protein [Cyanobacteria bacterium J06628_4]